MNDLLKFLKKDIQFTLLAFIAASLSFSPTHIQINSFFILFFTTVIVAGFFINKKRLCIENMKGVLLFMSLYLLYVLGFTGSDNRDEAGFELQKKLGLLLFPVLIGLSKPLTSRQVMQILLMFVLSCALTGIYCLIAAAIEYASISDPSLFSSHKLSGISGMHASYLSMYACFSIAVLLYFRQSKSLPGLLMNNFVFLFLIFFFIVLIILLTARTQLAILISGALISFLYYFVRSGKRILIIFGSLAMISILGVAFYFIPSFWEKIKEAINYKSEYTIDKQWGGRALRELKWNCAMNIILEHPLTGVGTGDVQDELQKCYEEKKFNALVFWKNTRYNTHNQFLEITAETGISGLILLFLCFAAGILHSLQRRKFLYLIFLLIFFISCQTESMLERQNGVVFYALMNSLFFFSSNAKSEQERN